jgi:hypothetical protein
VMNDTTHSLFRRTKIVTLPTLPHAMVIAFDSFD